MGNTSTGVAPQAAAGADRANAATTTAKLNRAFGIRNCCVRRYNGSPLVCLTGMTCHSPAEGRGPTGSASPRYAAGHKGSISSRGGLNGRMPRLGSIPTVRLEDARRQVVALAAPSGDRDCRCPIVWIVDGGRGSRDPKRGLRVPSRSTRMSSSSPLSRHAPMLLLGGGRPHVSAKQRARRGKRFGCDRASASADDPHGDPSNVVSAAVAGAGRGL